MRIHTDAGYCIKIVPAYFLKIAKRDLLAQRDHLNPAAVVREGPGFDS